MRKANAVAQWQFWACCWGPPRTREVGPCLAVAQASDGFWEWLKRLQAIRLIWEGDLVFDPSPPICMYLVGC